MHDLSPSAGEVTYANNTRSGSSDSVLIEEGNKFVKIKL